MKKTKLAIAMALLPFSAIAQTAPPMVPAIDHNGPLVVAVNAPSDHVSMNAKEQRALEIAREWKNNPDKPRKSPDGGVVYLYGATLPTLICTPLQVCAIRLQPGEEVNDVHAGDSVHWVISPALIGSGPSAITAVMVKPRESGFVTNLVINTNRRSYTLKLMATRHEWVSYVAFDYPDEQAKTWENFKAKQGRAENASTMKSGQKMANLDFDFKLSGDNPNWKPIRVYYDRNGHQTTIQFPSSNFGDDAPVLFLVGKGKSLWSGSTEKLVNYIPIGDTYVVNQIIDEAVLISGVGSNQTKVTITRGKDK